MKLDLDLIKDIPPYSRFTGKLNCKLTRGDSTLEQYIATIKFLGFHPVETNDDYTTYELGSNARVETLKREFIHFVRSGYGTKYIIDKD